MHRVYKGLFFGAIASAIAFSVHAGTVTCEGTVAALSYHQPGQLHLALSSMNTIVKLCSTDQEWVTPGSLYGTTTIVSCMTIYSLAVAAKKSGTTVSITFDGDQMPSSCTSFAAWTPVNVRYIHLYP